jgi:TPR repeat protein
MPTSANPVFAAAAAAVVLLAACAGGARANPLEEAAHAYASEHFVRAERFVRPLAERGVPRAETLLGVMYLRGQGAPQNYQLAAQWFRAAAEAGEPAAQYFLGELYDRGLGVTQDFVLAEAWLDIAVARAGPLWRRPWALIRDAIAQKLSRADLEEAQRLAADWRR